MNSQQAYISVLLVFAVIVGGGASTALASAGGTASAVPEPRVQPQVSNGSVSNVTPALEFTSQTSYGASVVLDEANLSAGGFVAVHRGEGTSGPIVGISRRFDRGAYQDVRVRLFDVPGRNFARTDLGRTQNLTAVPYLDTTNNSRFDYVATNESTDFPYLRDGSLVTNPATVRVNDSGPANGTTGVLGEP